MTHDDTVLRAFGADVQRLIDGKDLTRGRTYELFREVLLGEVWGANAYVEVRTVDVHVGRLRKALRQPGAPDLIRTVRSAGYALDTEG